MRSTTAILALVALGAVSPLSAQEVTYEIAETSANSFAEGGERILQVGPASIPEGTASYGPFRVLDAGRAALRCSPGPPGSHEYQTIEMEGVEKPSKHKTVGA